MVSCSAHSVPACAVRSCLLCCPPPSSHVGLLLPLFLPSPSPHPLSLADFDVSGGAVFNVSGVTSRVVEGCGGIDTDAVCITVDNLQPNTEYTFRVAAVFEQGKRTLASVHKYALYLQPCCNQPL